MTIWKVATIVSSSCVFALGAFGAVLLLRGNETTRLDFHFAAVLVGIALYLELFIFAFVAFAGYFFGTFGKIRKYADWQTTVKRVDISDLRGLLISSALVIIALVLGKVFLG